MDPPASVVRDSLQSLFEPVLRDSNEYTDDDEAQIAYKSAYPLPVIAGMPWVQQKAKAGLLS